MKVLTILFIFSISLHAQDIKQYKLEGKIQSFFKQDNIYYSKDCKKSCEAKTKFERFKNAKIQKTKSKFAKSIASHACKLMQGSSVFGVDEDKNMMAFCRFSDNSLIEYRSLDQHFGKTKLSTN